MKRSELIVFGLALLLVGTAIGFYLADSELGPVTSVPKAEAAGGRKAGADRALLADPNGTVSNPFQYYPGTEALGRTRFVLPPAAPECPPHGGDKRLLVSCLNWVTVISFCSTLAQAP